MAEPSIDIRHSDDGVLEVVDIISKKDSDKDETVPPAVISKKDSTFTHKKKLTWDMKPVLVATLLVNKEFVDCLTNKDLVEKINSTTSNIDKVRCLLDNLDLIPSNIEFDKALIASKQHHIMMMIHHDETTDNPFIISYKKMCNLKRHKECYVNDLARRPNCFKKLITEYELVPESVLKDIESVKLDESEELCYPEDVSHVTVKIDLGEMPQTLKDIRYKMFSLLPMFIGQFNKIQRTLIQKKQAALLFDYIIKSRSIITYNTFVDFCDHYLDDSDISDSHDDTEDFPSIK